MDIVYGLVSSWRLGRSLGVDLICQENGKVCSFDCVYCSLGGTTEKTVERRTFVDTGTVEKEIGEALERVEADVVTISGTGEPTLAQNLGEVIDAVRKVSVFPVAVLTNSSLKFRKDVREDLAKADVVVGSLDAPNDELFRKINRPHEEILFDEVVRGMVRFREEFEGEFLLEVMFVSDNKDSSEEIAEVARKIGPDGVQINTPLRPSSVRPLSPRELREVQESFDGMEVRSVYEAKKVGVKGVVGVRKLRRLKRLKEK